MNQIKPRYDSSMFDREINAFEDEYQQEIIENMKAMEASTLADASKIDLQPEITWGMRSEIINFMIYVHSNLRLSPNTLFLAINIFDRYCSKRIILLEHRDLVSSTSISIAAKYLEEKRRTPTINQLKKIMGGEFTDFQFAETEIHILSTLGFTVGHPTCESFLDIIFTKDTTITVRHVARYLCEMSFYHRDFLHFTSSMIAYSAKILTLHIFNVQSLNCAENLRLMAANEDFIHCLSLLANHIQKPSAYLHMKYADSSLSHAAQVVEIFVNKYNQMMHTNSTLNSGLGITNPLNNIAMLAVDTLVANNNSSFNGVGFGDLTTAESPMSIRSDYYSSGAPSPASVGWESESPISSANSTITTTTTTAFSQSSGISCTGEVYSIPPSIAIGHQGQEGTGHNASSSDFLYALHKNSEMSQGCHQYSYQTKKSARSNDYLNEFMLINNFAQLQQQQQQQRPICGLIHQS